jgi:hypothetical protein
MPKQSSGNSGGGFFSGFNIGDAFDVGLSAYIAREDSRARGGEATILAEQNALLNRPDSITQRPGAQPVQTGMQEITAGSNGGAGSRITLPGGLEVNATALYIAGGALAIALILKVAS